MSLFTRSLLKKLLIATIACGMLFPVVYGYLIVSHAPDNNIPAETGSTARPDQDISHFCQPDAAGKLSGKYTPEQLDFAVGLISAQLRQTLANSASAREQALAAYLGTRMNNGYAASYLQQHKECADSASCSQAVNVEAKNLRLRSFQELLQLAANTKDSNIYAYAYEACQKYGSSQTSDLCSVVSAKSWVQLNPAQPAANFALLAEGLKRHQLQDIRAALQMLAQIPEEILIPSAESSLVQTAVFTALSARGQDLWMNDSYASGFSSQSFFIAQEACQFAVKSDPDIAPVCAQLATQLATHSNRILDRAAAASIGKGSGWSDTQAEKLTAESAVLFDKLKALQSTMRNGSCSSFAQSSIKLRQIFQQGELASMRK